jgi:NADH:ubiquinone oxidoreductase subunit D
MKVLCIDNKNVSLSITVGKWYEVSEEWKGSIFWYIINDSGKKSAVFSRISKSKFLTVEQIREKKLNILDI